MTTTARLGAITNLVHGFIYFAPDSAEEYSALGLAKRQHYFASRGAPFGAVGPEIVIATFFNFNPETVRAAIPEAWTVAEPASVQAARFRAAQRVLDALEESVSGREINEAIAIAQAMVDGVGDEGKPLAAANRAIELPADPLLRLWQLVSVIREWRGDAHVAVLSAAPTTSVEALILHAATGQVPARVLQSSRAWSDQAWQAGITSLARRGLVDSEGDFTDAGRDFREAIERDTNRAAQPLVDAVGDEQATRLCELLKPLRNGLLASGVFQRSLR